MKTKLIAVALIAAAIPAGVAAQRVPAASIVVVDTDRIFRECNACRTAQTQLQAQITSLQQRAQTLGTPLQQEAQAIEQAGAALRNQTGAARTTGQTQLEQRIQALRQRESTANQELAAAQQNLRSIQASVSQQISARLNPIINQVMTSRGANLAVSTDATLAHAAGINVTTEVLGLLNQQLPSVSLTPLPAQPGQQPAPAQPQQPRPQGR